MNSYLELKRVVIYLFFFVILIALGGIFCELIWSPALVLVFKTNWIFPNVERVYKWGKFIALVSPPCALIMWVHDIWWRRH
jgi:hypothetical protein